ncbi:hypothetical protein GALMADRAFT_218880 [Galerina marginata CBS 339.88]|uniref:F-box domain-containing protein n=1 Tax=Galerina marginata (strain CBS 339.88) TaxID=685588 RepID=A0A067TRH2_GALM3|nr:hypothetical protein GALMADRAFT_218880 [Galerina marginata CBS 339.88]
MDAYSKDPLDLGSANTKNASQEAVLENFDLLENIFSFFEPPSDVSSASWALSLPGRQALLNAALTCKVFVDPAMDILWRSMDSLTPLVKILPTFVMIGTEYTVNGAILDSHLRRVDDYARRIRRLRLDSLHSVKREIWH